MISGRPQAVPRTKPRSGHGLARRRLRGALVSCGVCLLLLRLGIAFAQINGGGINREYPLKALFVYNFGSYFEWPPDAFPDADAPFTIGVLGPTPLNSSLQQIASTKTIGKRKIVLTQFASPDRISACQILFVPESISVSQQRQIIELLRGRPVLVVGESPNFASDGGCVNFFLDANKIRFEVNLAATRLQKLKASSKLLSIAKVIEGSTAPVAR